MSLEVLEDRTLLASNLTIENPNPSPNDGFGGAIAIQDNLLVVGAARGRSGGVREAGVAYVFNADTGQLLFTLNNPRARAGDRFGGAVAFVNGDIVVGAPMAQVNGADKAGRVYVFNADTGSLLRTINNPTPAFGELFGRRIVDVDGNMAVSAPKATVNGQVHTGSVYLYTGTTSTLVRTINNPNPGQGDRFGKGMAAWEGGLVVGAPRGTTGGVNSSGVAYVYDATGNLIVTLSNASGVTDDRFGRSIAVANDVILVGAPNVTNSGVLKAGAVFVFDATSGEFLDAFLNDDPEARQRFGSALAGFGDLTLIGAKLSENGIAPGTGLVFYFDVNSGELFDVQEADDPAPGEFYGAKVAAAGGVNVVSAPRGVANGVANAGVVYVYFTDTIITGLKFHDLNGNGFREEGEPGLPGWTFFLDRNNNGVLDSNEPTAVSDANGFYRFENLTPGTYAVREVPQAGWVQTSANPAPVTVGANESVSGGNFGNFRTITISGIKFHDLNGNGIQDPDDVGLSGWTIFLDANGNNVLDPGEVSTVTGADGSYSFTNLGPGNYEVREVLQEGWVLTTQLPPFIVASSGQNVTNANFGNFQTFTVSGLKFHDLNGNGVQDEGEPALAGRTIFADTNGNGILDDDEPFAITDENGEFTIVGVGPGAITIREVLPDGWTESTEPQVVTGTSGQPVTGIVIGNFQTITITGFKFRDLNRDGVFDEGEPGLPGWTFFVDVNGNGVLDAGEPFGISDENGNFVITGIGPGTIRLREVLQPGWLRTTEDPAEFSGNSGETFEGFFFGNFQLARISGLKFNDLNGNGVQDEGELGLGGWVVFADLNDNGVRDEDEPFAITDETGVFTIVGLEAGSYLIREEIQPGWIQTTVNPAPVDVEEGEGVGGVVFGNFQLILISGQKFNDLNGNGVKDEGEPGIPGWTIFLDDNDNGELDEGEVFVVTDAEGKYSFPDLGPGTYLVREELQTGWVATTTPPALITAVSGGDAMDVDFGNFQLVAIHGQKFNDLDGNGVPDPEEPGLPGWFIFIDLNEDGVLDEGEPFVVTDENGNYAFNDLGPGTYLIREVVQAGWLATTPLPDPITVVSGQDVLGVDFGNFQRVTISGLKFDDRDGDGIQGPGEAGLDGWTIFLDANDNGELDEGEAFVVTDPNGAFVFTDLGPGTYVVREVLQPGWTQTTPQPGAIAASSGNDVSDVLFGNFRNVALGGTAFNDLDGNGVRDEGEPGLEGWTVFLDENGDGILDDGETRVLTDEAGDYVFTSLGPGTYRVRMVLLEAWTQTTPNPDPIAAQSGQSVTGIDFGAQLTPA